MKRTACTIRVESPSTEALVIVDTLQVEFQITLEVQLELVCNFEFKFEKKMKMNRTRNTKP